MKLLIRITFVLFCFLLVVEQPVKSQERKEFKIGALLQLTGELASTSQAMLDGAKLAVDEINDAAKNFKLKIVSYDHQANSQRAFMYAKKLVEVDKVDAILISDYHPAKSIGNYAEKHKIPAIVLWDSNPELENMGYFTFGIGSWTPGSGELVASAAKSKFNAKRAVTIAYQDEWALACRDYFKKKFIAGGGEVLSDDIVQNDESDYRTILAKIKAKNPDIIYYLLSTNNVTFLKQYRELGLKQFLFTSDVLTDSVIAEARPEFEGVFQTQSTDPDFNATKLMIEKYKARFGKDSQMVPFMAWGYDAVGIVAETISKGAVNAEQIADGLYAIKDYQGASGPITINQRGSAPRYVGLYQVKNGQLTLAE